MEKGTKITQVETWDLPSSFYPFTQAIVTHQYPYCHPVVNIVGFDGKSFTITSEDFFNEEFSDYPIDVIPILKAIDCLDEVYTIS